MGVLEIMAKWIHVAGAVVWVGGMFFAVSVFIPVLSQQVDMHTHRRILSNIVKRFRKIVGVAIVLLLISGQINAYYLIILGEASNPMAAKIVLIIKTILALGILSIFLLAPKLSSVSRHYCCSPEPAEIPSPGEQAVLDKGRDLGALLHVVALSLASGVLLCAMILTQF